VRLADLLSLPLAALWQQKSRTLLTTLGVVFGSFVLAASLSIGQGVQDVIDRESHRSDFLRRIAISPTWEPMEPQQPVDKIPVSGTMTDEKRSRIRQAIHQQESRGRMVKPRKPLTRDRLRELAALPHVHDITPNIRLSGFAVLQQKAEATEFQAASIDDTFVHTRVVAGRSFANPHDKAVLVSEFLLYRWGIADDAAVQGVLGKKLRLEIHASKQPDSGFYVWLVKPEGNREPTLEETAALDTIRQQLPASLDKLGLTSAQIQLLRKSLRGEKRNVATVISEEFEIVGVLRAPTSQEQQQPWEFRWAADVVLPVETALDFVFRDPRYAESGVEDIVVRTDGEEYTKDVYQRIKDSGWEARAPLDFVERERLQYLLIFSGMTCVAAVALLVAALGIANTMLMSVLERTREIGIMKAVGASNGQLQTIFLIEGLLIGVVGGSLGLLLAWVSSFFGDAWVRSLASRFSNVELKETLFVFPTWLIVTVLLFAVVVTTLAAFYPARRAAKIDPVAALRHE
jgi:putative ABC transport system permease protein